MERHSHAERTLNAPSEPRNSNTLTPPLPQAFSDPVSPGGGTGSGIECMPDENTSLHRMTRYTACEQKGETCQVLRIQPQIQGSNVSLTVLYVACHAGGVTGVPSARGARHPPCAGGARSTQDPPRGIAQRPSSLTPRLPCSGKGGVALCPVEAPFKTVPSARALHHLTAQSAPRYRCVGLGMGCLPTTAAPPSYTGETS
jgi:hypothetical protein